MTEQTEATENKAAELAAKEAAKAEKAAQREAAKAEKAAQREAEKAQKIADKAALKEANKMPVQNEVRRPKPETLCGRAWAVFEEISEKTGAPASIADSLVRSKELGLNDGNVRAEYARWRKFYGISGRVGKPAKQAEPAVA